MSDLAIELVNLEKQFTLNLGVRRRRALDRLSLTVERGEIYGFLGPNGAGKTTSIKILTSLLRQDAGEARVFGADPSLESTRRMLGFLPESPVFYDHLTGREFLKLCGKLCAMSSAAIRKRSGELLERVGLAHAGDLQIRRYSKGMNQRLGIAQAILHDPELVILDEPMSGLDPMGRADIRDLIVELRKSGKTIFFSTHIIPDVEVICDRIGLVNHGRMVAEGSVHAMLDAAKSKTTEVLVTGLPPAFALGAAQEAAASASGQRLFLVESEDALTQLISRVMTEQARIVSVTPRRESLEDLVVRMLDQDHRERAA
jgi:ABC-2 type transport system ATP-binding protein